MKKSNLKRLLALMLALVMTMAMLTGCITVNDSSNSEDDDEPKKPEATQSSGTSVPTTAPTQGSGTPTTAPTQGSDDPTTAPTQGGNEPATTPTESGNFDIGQIDGNTYINTFAGIRCQLGSDWKLLTEEEIRQINETSLGLVGDNYKELLKQADSITDMMATHSNQTDTISVGLEKLPGAYAALTEEQYLEMSKDLSKAALESMGMTDVKLTVTSGTFAGETHGMVEISAKLYGFDVYEKIAVVKCGEYMCIVTVCTLQTNNCQALLDMFQAYAEA